MNEYSAHLLRYGKGADMVISSTALPQCPGTAFTCPDQSDRDILLAGGFPKIHPDAPFPLSPTLQLNGDLTDLDAPAMAAIGRAELIRSNSQSFRSYALDPDPRITVLGANVSQLHAFIDRYSGVLHIDPLLVEGYDRNLSTAQQLEILNQGDEYLLSFLVRQPVNLEQCTYCGACGPVCPEFCLSEQLYLDFSRCTFCKKCMVVCPHGAIDLDEAERRTLQTPAVLLLEGVRIDLPQQHDGIYPEKDLKRLFDTIYAAQIEEVISCDQSICQYSGKLGTGCNICLSACSSNAVSRDDNGIHIDHRKCTECGNCLADCPTGALQYARFNDATFIEYFRTVEIHTDMTVVLGTEKNLHRFWWQTARTKFAHTLFLEFPQPHALNSMHLFLLYAMGVTRIIILRESNTKNTTARLQVKLVNGILEALFNNSKTVLFSDPNTLAQDLMEHGDPNPLLSRYRDFSYSNRREKLADLLSFFCRSSTAEPTRLTGPAVASFGEITCATEKCTLCSACVGECKIGALTADSSTFSLNHQPSLCVQCGVCIELCPEEALTPRPGLALQAGFFNKERLAQAEPVQCLECGKVFGTRQSLTRVMTMLTKKNLWDNEDNLLSYCETCRVVKMFESQKESGSGN